MNRTYLGKNVQTFVRGDDILRVDKVIVNYGIDDNGATLSQSYGVHTDGRVVEKTLSTITDATAAMATAISLYTRYQTDPYKAVMMDGAELDPAAELGDGITANGVFSVIGNITTDFSEAMYADVQSQGQPEDDDFPYLSKEQREIVRNNARVGAQLKVLSNAINLKVSSEEAQSLIDLNLNGITISYTPSMYANSCNITLSKAGVSITGKVTMEYIYADAVRASWVYAGNISANQITSGRLISSYLKLCGETEIYESAISQNPAGWIGYGHIASSSFSDWCIGLIGHGRSVCVVGEAYAYISGGQGYYTQVENYLAGGSAFRPVADDTYNLGSSYTRWSDVYASNGAIQTSDRAKKKDIKYTLNEYEGFFDSLKPVSYKFKSGTRTHLGLIAQDVEDNLAKHHMSGVDFAGFCKDKKSSLKLTEDETGKHYQDIEKSGYDYSLRYDEFIGLLIDQVQKLKARVTELERRN